MLDLSGRAGGPGTSVFVSLDDVAVPVLSAFFSASLFAGGGKDGSRGSKPAGLTCT